ncbi:MAG: type II secretion system protein [Gemmatimonadaceae bacterium]
MTPLRGRSGVSLIEILVVVVLLGIAGAVIGSAILDQQRFHRNASELLSARQGVRDAMEVLSADIRGSSTEDTLRVVSDSALELFAAIGASVACRTISGNSIALAGESATGNTLTSFLLVPDTGDLALIYRESPDSPGGEWNRHRIAALTARSGSPNCVADGAEPGEGFLLTLQSPPAEPVKRGAPVRFIRRGRYSLYRSSDSQWNLGYRRCNALGVPACGAVQPVSGPYRRYTPDNAETGFLLEYFNAEGERVPGVGSALSITRVDVTARAERAKNRRPGSPGISVPEIATASIAIRNR